ncbi:MAG: NfeD family protein [Myxococcota bacterium]
MLTYAYLASLVFGGVLIGASILLGGHDDADLDADGDADFDADGDVDVDGDFDADGDAGGDKGGIDVGDGASLFIFLKSLRFWTFFLAFFGLTGLILDGGGIVESEALAFALALVMGVFSGVGTTSAIRALARDESGSAAHGGDYIGRTGKIIVPVKPGGVGRVRVEVKGQLVDVLATSDEELANAEEAMIIEMDGTRAKLARVADD